MLKKVFDNCFPILTVLMRCDDENDEKLSTVSHEKNRLSDVTSLHSRALLNLSLSPSFPFCVLSLFLSSLPIKLEQMCKPLSLKVCKSRASTKKCCRVMNYSLLSTIKILPIFKFSHKIEKFCDKFKLMFDQQHHQGCQFGFSPKEISSLWLSWWSNPTLTSWDGEIICVLKKRGERSKKKSLVLITHTHECTH